MSERGNHEERAGTLRAIAVFKFFKALVLFAVALSGLELLRGAWFGKLLELSRKVVFAPGGPKIAEKLDEVLQLGPGKLGAAAVAAALYGALFLVEGIGLWRMKHWAEYLTIVSTTLLIPLEIIELVRSSSPAKWLTLAINVAIVVYLVVRVRSRRRHARGERRHGGRAMTGERAPA